MVTSRTVQFSLLRHSFSISHFNFSSHTLSMTAKIKLTQFKVKRNIYSIWLVFTIPHYFFTIFSLSFPIPHCLSLSFPIPHYLFHYLSLSLTIFPYPSLSFPIPHYLFTIPHYLFTIFRYPSLSFHYLSLSFTIP